MKFFYLKFKKIIIIKKKKKKKFINFKFNKKSFNTLINANKLKKSYLIFLF